MNITVLVAAAFFFTAAPALAAPANDNFVDAEVPSTEDTSPTSGSNVDATKEAGEPDHGGDAGGASVWYRWTASDSGRARGLCTEANESAEGRTGVSTPIPETMGPKQLKIYKRFATL